MPYGFASSCDGDLVVPVVLEGYAMMPSFGAATRRAEQKGKAIARKTPLEQKELLVRGFTTQRAGVRRTTPRFAPPAQGVAYK
mmetsp:Transcript_5477/g.16813  ORF Transcript_5477/g.16813 Transcript_5477/m.16813 type:complete len:83 (-) Transcript_5477:4109-4357(-)